MRTRGVVVGSFASLCFGAGLVVNKVGLAQSALHPLDYTALSVTVAGLLGCFMIVPKRVVISTCSRLCWLNIVFLGVTASGVSYVLIFWGQSMTQAINAGFLLSLSAFFTMIFASVFLHEAIEKRKYVFIILLFVGIYILVVGAHALQLSQGDILIVIAAMTLGGTNVLSTFAMREMKGELVASLRMIVGAILLLGLVLLRSPHVLTALDGHTSWVLVSGVLMWGFKVVCDSEVDVLRIFFSNVPIEESDEDKQGVIIDYDKEGNIIGLEILDASKRMENPRSVEFAVTS
jgi:drug/metabolite transporter (DMT)-like permease/uncharacterized protein YuzE